MTRKVSNEVHNNTIYMSAEEFETLTIDAPADLAPTASTPAPLPVSAPAPPADSPRAAPLTPAEASRAVACRCLLHGAGWLRLALAGADSQAVYNGGIRWRVNGAICAAFPLPEALVIGIDLRDGIPAHTLVFQPLTLSQLKEFVHELV